MNATTRLYLHRAVKRGSKRLDQRNPNWYKKIVARDLDLSQACNCVIGQVYGDYDDNFIKRAVGYVTKDMWATAASHGFNVPTRKRVAQMENLEPQDFYCHRDTEMFHYLDKLWLKEIRARRAADRS